MSTQQMPMMRALAACVRANVPVLIWGSPGLGKTAVLTRNADAWGRHLETVIGSVREASDFMGLPIELDGQVHYSPLAWAKRLAGAPKGLLYLGELTTSAPSVQKAMLRVVQERWVGDLHFPDSVSIVADANPVDQAVDGWDLPAPVSNRFVHLPWTFNPEQWLSGLVVGFANLPVQALDAGLNDNPVAARVRVAASVAAYLRGNPARINPGPPDDGHGAIDPEKAGGAWPSPRSWTNTVEALSHLQDDDENAEVLLVKGGVGEQAAREYMAWKMTTDLIDPWEAMRDPGKVPWQTARVDQLFTLVHAVAAVSLGAGDRATWVDALKVMVACANAGKPDVALPAVHILARQSQFVRDGLPRAVLDTFGSLLHRAHLVEEAAA